MRDDRHAGVTRTMDEESMKLANESQSLFAVAS